MVYQTDEEDLDATKAALLRDGYFFLEQYASDNGMSTFYTARSHLEELIRMFVESFRIGQ